MPHVKITSKEVPIEQIKVDPNQPRSDFGTKGERNRFINSIKAKGILNRLAVSQIGKDEYFLIDGHRRLLGGQEAGLKTVPIDIFSVEVTDAEFDQIRFELQNDRRAWKPFERSKALVQIKKKKQFSDAKQLADFLHLSPNSMNTSLKLQILRDKYEKLMNDNNLSETYQVEFIRLQPKIRPIKELTVEQIIKNIFERVKHKVIDSAKDFRRLGSVFLRAHANEAELHRFLKNPDMTVEELAERTNRSGFIRDVENVMRQISERRGNGLPFSEEDQSVLQSCAKLLKDTLRIS